MVLAEYTALRAEILQRSSLQWNMFALQLTAAGVVFSFALSNSTHTGFLLILPVVSYDLTGRYVSQVLGTQNAAAYIREVLEPRTGGTLHWETWNRALRPRARVLTFLNPLFLAFPGVSVTALAWVAPFVWAGRDVSAGKRILVVIIWLVGLVVTGLSVQLIARVVSRHWNPDWRQRLKSLASQRPKTSFLHRRPESSNDIRDESASDERQTDERDSNPPS
jgi:hypothetical protein